ncbi:cyclin-L1 [Centruroides vittatus]|uniref:cyclin-L1 n=1 Tax=Centruroides vittatus TaxID=120091 RepID=UPI0035107AB5
MAVAQTNNSTTPPVQKAQYGKVILSLENCILPPEKISPTPSLIDGLDQETEMDLRILGCELIQTSGILLRLPQVAMATGQVLFQRFYYSKSFVRHSMEIVAMACITLASKIEEAPRRIRDVINVFHHIKQVRTGKTIQPLILDQNYINLKNQVIKAERRILKELGFCVHVKHPHKIIVTLLEVLKCKNQKLMQTAWNYMNDSLRTNVFVKYHPETIACACIYLSARLLKIPLPNKPPWYLIFNVTENNIQDICSTILHLYARKKADPEKLEKIIEDLRKAHQEAKLKAKGISGNSTPTPNASSGFSPGSRQNSPKQGHSPVEVKREKDVHNSAASPKNEREPNHVAPVKRKPPSLSPNSPSPSSKKDRSGSSASHSGSRSPSPKRRAKTPPRSYKPVHRARSRSRTREIKENKHRSFHKRKRSHSRSRSKSHSHSPHRHSKRSYKKEREREKLRHMSRSRSRERNHHSNSYEKSHKSRKERSKDISNHRSRSRERSRR